MSGVELRQVGNGSLIKLGLITGFCFWGLVGLIFGLLAAFGANTVRRTGIPLHGFEGFATSMVMSAVFALVHTLALAFGGAMARSFPATRRLVLGRSVDDERQEESLG